MMSGDSDFINTGCEKTIVNLEKDHTEIEGTGLPGEARAKEQSTLLGHLKESSGTKAWKETKFSTNFAIAEAQEDVNCEAGHANNGEDMEILHAEQPNIMEQFVPKEVSAILLMKS